MYMLLYKNYAKQINKHRRKKKHTKLKRKEIKRD